jgi:hypothetical protein
MKTVYMVYCTMFEDGYLSNYGTYSTRHKAEERKAALETENNEYEYSIDSLEIEELIIDQDQ